MHAFLEVLATPGRVLEIRRTARRRLFDRGFACLPLGGQGRVTLAVEEGGEIRSLFFFSGAEDLACWLIADMELYPAPEIPLAAFHSLSRDAWLAVAGLCDLFLQAYPLADPNWKPGEPIQFTVDDLLRKFQEAPTAADSWLGGFASMFEQTLPQPARDDLETILWVLCNERLLVPQDVESEEDVFVIGAKLAWALRCLAWWDRGFLIRESAGAARSLLIVQASALWRIVRDQPSSGSEIYDAEAVDGKLIKETLIRNFVENPADLTREELAAVAVSPAPKTTGRPTAAHTSEARLGSGPGAGGTSAVPVCPMRQATPRQRPLLRQLRAAGVILCIRAKSRRAPDSAHLHTCRK